MPGQLGASKDMAWHLLLKPSLGRAPQIRKVPVNDLPPEAAPTIWQEVGLQD
jgi:hypothetical protein